MEILGWSSIAMLRRYLGKIPVTQPRSMGASQLHDAGYPDSAITEILDWSSMVMLRRYLGKIRVAQLKRYPTTLERVLERAG